MIITCISDLHGHFPDLEGGDLLIIAGDLTARDLPNERTLFLNWLADQEYRKKIWIAGNHDNSLVGLKFDKLREDAPEYLCDSGTEFEGLKIWGSPFTKTFPGMNPHYMAFTCDTDEELAKKWALIPDGIDILVTHSPPHGCLDCTITEKKVGCKELLDRSIRIKPFLHCFGHIHENYGKKQIHWRNKKKTLYVNASHVNERYEPVNPPIRIEL